MDADGTRETAPDAPRPAVEEGGEPACLLARLCPQCDAVPEGPPAAECWRCGADLRSR
ncbi:hypothetical protein [Kitasatospora paranensis]|uniref:Uncharacterized protein n=1 Tax=Kitasatospora paranensis TaxID=258053 RepID=A0ABW2G4T0_9ACTN